MTRRQLIGSMLAAALPAQTRIASSGKVGGRSMGTPGVHKYVPAVGQSLSVGGNGNPALSAHDDSTGNLMFAGGTCWDSLTAPDASFIASLIPLAEGSGQSAPATNNTRETHCSGFANQVSAWARANGLGAQWDSITGSWGIGAQAYSALKKGTEPYSRVISAVTRLRELVPNGVVPALLCMHGEADGSCSYVLKVEEWQSDYEADIKAVTGQSGLIPMLISQTDVGECASGGIAPDPTFTGMLAAFERNPTKVLLVGPKYFLPYSDSLHLTNQGYRWMGEMYAKAYWKHIVLGQQWSPLRPVSISTTGNVSTIQFAGFVAPLVFDTTAVSNPGNYGFEYAGGDVSITGVSITDATNGIVQVTYSGSPANVSNMNLRYAYTGGASGPTTGARGCLRDSDSLTGLDGNHLYNWCVHWSKPVNWSAA